jgi:RNA-directed DNA polymerase
LSLGNRWNAINWRDAAKEVRRLQMRIAKAVKSGKRNKVKSLQWMMTHSLSARFLAVKRVTSRKGARTPGVDGEVWNTSAKKMRGALSLQRNGYKASPLRRILIPKRNGKMRPLGIPTMKDRAMQALYLLALEPVAETLADTNSYGFRPYRACRDAIGQCFCALGRRFSPKWILEADIKACFDWISHDWILKNIPSDRKMLAEWLRCGFMQERKLFPTRDGTPQGGVISPTLANMALDGLENAVRKVSHPKRDKVNFIRYADDFVVTASSKEHLEQAVLPAIESFLRERGLSVSPEKTRVVHIEQGFDFLGQNIRKHRNKLIMEPSKESTMAFKDKVKSVIRKAKGWNAGCLIEKLNPVIRGWSTYHRHIQSHKTFCKMHEILYRSLVNWAKHDNSGKTRKWIRNRFLGLSAKRRFSSMHTDYRGKRKLLEIISPRDIKLVRYIKIKGESNPFNPIWLDYFKMRRVAWNCSPC